MFIFIPLVFRLIVVTIYFYSVEALKEAFTSFKCKLSDDDDGCERKLVLVQRVSPDFARALPNFEPTVFGFMTCASSSLGLFVRFREIIAFRSHTVYSAINPVSFDHFARTKLFHQVFFENSNIVHLPARERAFEPDNITRLDVCGNLVPNSCSTKLMAVPYRVKWKPTTIFF